MDAWKMIPEGGKILGSIDKMIQWFRDREGKVTYSMTNRLGLITMIGEGHE